MEHYGEVLVNSLDLLSFILVTPELIGVERIDAFNKFLHRLTVGIIASIVRHSQGDLVSADDAHKTKYDPSQWSKAQTLGALGGGLLVLSGPGFAMGGKDIGWKVAILWFAVIGFVCLSWAWEFLLTKYRVTRIMLAVGAVIFFCTRVLAISNALSKP